ncbi:PIN domain-containing protein [Candidatus Micrarchaeota archaeon]|nr:PIN domain-containing protein [Candidatus Micrarchaeota archaeon]
MIYAVDTWFILSIWNKEPKSQDTLNEIGQGKAQLVISYAAVAEAARKLMQQGNGWQSIETLWSMLESFEKIRFVQLDKTIALESARISMKYGIPLIDAIIAATAKLSGCDVLLSADEDMAVLAKKKYLKVQSW